MKTIKDLFELVGQAVENNNDHTSNQWFIDYSGHVNRLNIRYYLTGWSKDNDRHCDNVSFTIDEDGIQGAYWFIKTRLR
jgi:hypothetical protein